MKISLVPQSMPGVVFGAAAVIMASAGCMTKPQSGSPQPALSKQSAAEIQAQEHQKDVDRAARELLPPLSGKSNDGK
jgi:hypothetical protein